MPEQAERAQRKPYETSASKREAWITKIQTCYNRTPTTNELLALDNLPCGPYSKLFDRSRIGIYIFQRLRYAEDKGDVSVLEEAGRLLRLQMTNAWTPSTSCYDDQSSIPDLAEEPRFTEPLRQDHTSAQAEMEHEFGARDLPFRPSPARSTSQNDFLPAAPVSAVKAHIIHGDAYFMPVTLRFENQVTNSSIAINVPGRATATYPGPLTKDLKPGAGEKPFGPFVDKGSAEIGRLNEDLLGGEFVGC